MGSSHSAPRRPGARRNSARPFDASEDSPTHSSPRRETYGRDYSGGEYSSNSSSNQWPAEEELPNLLEEAGKNPDPEPRRHEQNYGRRRGNNNIEDAPMSPDTRRDRLLGLSVIQSSRSLRADELDVNESFTDDPTIRSPMRRPRIMQEDSEFQSPQFQSPPQQAPKMWGPPVVMTEDGNPFVVDDVNRAERGRLSSSGSISDDDEHGALTPSTGPVQDFFPQGSRHSEWMGRSLETLILGYASFAPILCLPEDEDDRGDDASQMWGATRRRSTVSTLGSEFGRRSSLGSFPGSRRGSLVGGGHMHGGTLANYFNRRRQNIDGAYERGTTSRRGSAASVSRRGSTSHGPSYRRRLSINRSGEAEDIRAAAHGGPNVALSILAREVTGRTASRNPMPASHRLRGMGGNTLFTALDRPAGGMCSEVAFLSEVIDSGDWAEAQTVISRISPRLIGDPSAVHPLGGDRANAVEDANLPPSASPYFAGGGRLGLERDAFVLAGGVDVLIRIFKEPSFVGAEMARTYDARDLSEELVATRLAPCWNEALASLRELVYAIPALVENDIIFDDGEFLPFLFTLLSHDSCFDGAAALIEEILSLQSHSPPQPAPDGDNLAEASSGYQATVRVSPPTTFFLGNVPDLYKLWSGFSCRQLAHFCRILALLVFEPEDRQLLESPAVLKSIELLQLRRNRAARAGRDSTVDMNQAILLGDEELVRRLLKLLRVMNFAPSLRRSSPYHVMAHFPFIADTLVMLGLNELDNWDEIDRLEGLARKMMKEDENGEFLPAEDAPQLSEVGAVADMLENLSTVLMGNPSETTNQLGHIIHVISAAQQAGVVVGRPRQSRSNRRRGPNQHEQYESAGARNGTAGPADGGTIEGLASAAGILTDQVFVRRFYANPNSDYDEDQNGPVQVVGIGLDGGQGMRDTLGGQSSGPRRPKINTPHDSANTLQFNALILGPYQVEVLFVLCTLLGGRRKIDAQEMLNEFGVISILDDMFQRLPWDSLSPTRQPISQRLVENQGGSNPFGELEDQQPNGIHGPGCECTPESALCVQYLRLLHNFCDRDCDNYAGRRLLLSEGERRFVFVKSSTDEDYDVSRLEPGLLSKIIAAFIGESDESPYRFWLASCVESYLRGSSPAEQVFVARSGLLSHLIDDITSERLHCAGSLQTSFDLLGELCKGNAEVLRLLVKDLDEERFRKLMSVAAANLVDSNVFIRSLLLSLERISSGSRLMPLHLDPSLMSGRRSRWRSHNGVFSRSYLTHSWWDTCLVNLDPGTNTAAKGASEIETASDNSRQSDWFPTMGTIEAYNMRPPEVFESPSVGLNDGVGHFGWIFSPVGDSLSSATLEPNTVERLSWFLAANQTRLLRDLLGVVDLRNINHENICCLNTAVVIAIFAHRRHQLHWLLQDLSRMNAEERETKRRALALARNDNIIDRAFVQAMKYMDIDRETPPAPYARRASLSRRASLTTGGNSEIGDRTDVMRNFREVLWFWFEYYTHRGRDRLSLEFSSHLRFQEWIEVVSLLGSDDGSPTSLVRSPVRLPRSPYQRAARITENPLRGV